MIIEGIDSVDLDRIYPGYTVRLKIVERNVVSSMVNTAREIGCKLILLNYGEFYFKEFISTKRNETINNILSD